MKYLFTILLLACSQIYSQNLLLRTIDSIGISSAQSYVPSVNITGNLYELVIPVGFLDSSNMIPFPTLV
jgi:hypothetical protein